VPLDHAERRLAFGAARSFGGVDEAMPVLGERAWPM
jgi:hypothetical protein